MVSFTWFRGGSGAKPYVVERTPEDQYQSLLFPNYHYIRFIPRAAALEGYYVPVANPEQTPLTVEAKDCFEIAAKSASGSALPQTATQR
jgi:hypothetical protein